MSVHTNPVEYRCRIEAGSGTHAIPWTYHLGEQCRLHFTVDVHAKWAGNGQWQFTLRHVHYDSIELIDLDGKSVVIPYCLQGLGAEKALIERMGRQYLESDYDCLREVIDEVWT